MPAWILPAAIAAGQLIGGLFGQSRQNKKNRQLAEFQADAQERYLQEQLEYNTPANQMLRFQQAGLNPNLVYGQGNPGNQSAPLSYPDVQPADYQSLFSSLGPLLNQSMMTASQTQAIDAKTRHTYAMTELNKIQQAVLKRNPLLDETGFKAIIDSLKSSAEIKATESTRNVLEANRYAIYGEERIIKDLELLDQRFRLGELDSAIKAQVLNSKEFQNVLLEIQTKWMRDAQITPQHILTFIQLFLMRVLSK